MSFRFVGELVGAVVAVVLVACIEGLGHRVYPLPDGLDFKDNDQVAQYMATLPVGALLFPISAWLIGTGAGAGTAARLSRHHPRISGGVVTGLMLIATIGQLVSIPHPPWMSLLAVVGIPAVGMTMTAVCRRRDVAAAPEPDDPPQDSSEETSHQTLTD